MTSSLRRKRQTTVVLTTPARMAASLVGFGLLLLGPRALAQDYQRVPALAAPSANTAAQEPVKVLHFHKPSIQTGSSLGSTGSALPAATPPGVQPATTLYSPPSSSFAPPAFRADPTPYPTPSPRPAFAPGPDQAIKPVGFQLRPDAQATPSEETQEYQVRLEPPGPQQLFRLESESALQERMRQEARQRPTPEFVSFPPEPKIGQGAYMGRDFHPSNLFVEPSYVCYQRLYFEQINAERYGWDLGFIHPFVSAGVFYWDLITLPYHIWTAPCQQFECSAGYCLPGDPVPLMLYPPELSLSGAVMEAGTAVGLIAIFP